MDLYNDAMQELSTQILNFQEEQIINLSTAKLKQ